MGLVGIFVVTIAGLAIARASLARHDFKVRRADLSAAISLAPPAPAPRVDLPAEVKSLADRMGVPSKHSPRAVHMTQSGVMTLSFDHQPVRFSAQQVSAVGRSAFCWDAKVYVGPIVAFVLDALIDDQACLEAHLFGIIRIAKLAASDAAYRGEAMRYLAELMWNPDAILYNPEVTWHVHAVDRFSATMGVGARRCEVTFILNAAGDVCKAEAEDRPRTVAGKLVPTPWRVEFSRYRLIGGRRIPTYGRVAWLVAGVERVYWRGHIDHWASVR